VQQADAKNGEAQQADADDGRFHISVISQFSAVYNNSVFQVNGFCRHILRSQDCALP
jgi:hypothetical protein